MDLTGLIGFGAFTPAVAGGSYIQSIQAFEITIGTGATSNTATITSVDTSKAVIFFAGQTTDNTTGTLREIMARVTLTNSTTVTATRDTSSASFGVTVRGTVVEFVSSAVSSIQYGTVTVASSATSGTATISSVTTSRSCLFYLGVTNTGSTTSGQFIYNRIDLTNSTTVTATRNTSSTAVLTVGFVVVEFASGITQSVQQRSVTQATSATTITDTISSVTTGNTLLVYNGVTTGTSTLTGFLYYLTLTNSTTVTLTRAGTGATTRTVNYTVLEFASGVVSTVQRGNTAIASATSANTAITSVNTSKAAVNYGNYSTGGSSLNEVMATAKLTSATNVRGEKNTAGAVTSTPSWEVIEFV